MDSNDPQGLAQKLYPDAAAAPFAARLAAEADSAAPEAIRQMRSADPARMLYGVGGLREVAFERAFNGDAAQANLTRNILADFGISDYDGQKILARAIHAKQGTAGTLAAQQAESRHTLAAEHGNADEALQLANRLVYRDPRMSRLLQSMGIGNDPEVVRIIADAARRERGRGRLA